MVNRLASARADVDEHTVILEPGLSRSFGDEVEHPLRLVGRKGAHIAERVDVPHWQHQQVGLGLRRDVPDRDEAVPGVDVVALGCEPAEEAVLRQRGSPPP
jgi:hypothetical protein